MHVTSSDFPRFDRNMNTGNEVGLDTHGMIATQRVFHQAEHASHILLPMVAG